MHPKLFASLHEAVEKWTDENCIESEGWPHFHWPNGGDLMLTNAIANAFDIMVAAAQQAEENAELEAADA
jgi:hypothetical protein